MNASPSSAAESPLHVTAFDTVRGLAALSYRFVEVPSMTLGKSLPKRFAGWKMRRVQTQPVSGK
ncbi:MAG: hypothetical protein C4583_15430 [Anaerolineaceae bacterium]|nr:MAG: hypothetical protein C4583_15430 [Anaerolineaceae bacterium]